MILTSSLGMRYSTLGAGMVLGPLPPPIVFDVFQTDPGIDAGRIEPTGVVPADGSYVFCLGHDTPGYKGFVQPGDYDEVSQTGTFPAGTVLSFQAVTRGPVAPPPTGYTWQADVLVDGTSVGSRVLAGDASVAWDWEVDLSGVSGSHELAFRLTYEGASLPGPPGLPVVEVEIPAFYVDALVFTSPTGPVITNEVPIAEQGEGDGPAPPDTTNVDFDVFGLGSNVVASSIAVTLNSVPAITAGVVQTGFHGSVGASAEVLHVTIAPNLAYASDSVVTVHVSARNVASVTHTRTWTFRVADITPPVMTSIQALSPTQLRVTWSKNVELVAPTGAHDGTNPNLYYVQAVQPDTVTPVVTGGPEGPLVYTPAPYVTVESVSVVSEASPCIVDLFTNVELSPGIPYLVTEVGVVDLVGNFVTSVTETVAFVPPTPLGRALNLYRLMPLMNRQEDVTQDLLRFLNCMQEPTSLLLYDIDTWTEIFDFKTAPDAFLSAILADLGNPFPFVLSTEGKRQLIAILVQIYEQKGTAIGIIHAVLFFLGLTVTITTYDSSGNWVLGESFLGDDPITPAGGLASVTTKVGSTVTMTGLSGLSGSEYVGRTLTVTGAASSGNNGSFPILSVPSPGTVTIQNAAGVASDANSDHISWSVSADPDVLGNCVLGPGGLAALFSFSVVSGISLTAEQIAQITWIANYMKPAHTHLLGIVVPVTPTPYDPVELGISELGVDWILHT